MIAYHERGWLEAKKLSFFLVSVSLTVVILLFIVFHTYTSGITLIEYIQTSNISQATIQKKQINNGTVTEDFGPFTLTSNEFNQFLEILGKATLKDIGKQPFTISTDTRYVVTFKGPSPFREATMKFYGDKVLIFDCIFDEQAPIHKRYSIISSEFGNFFKTKFC